MNLQEEQDNFIRYVKQHNCRKIAILLKEGKVDPSFYSNWAIRFSCTQGNINIVDLLLNDSRVDPSDDQNACIRGFSGLGFETNYDNISLLWKHNKIKESLKYDDFDLYERLMKKEVNNKLSEF